MICSLCHFDAAGGSKSAGGSGCDLCCTMFYCSYHAGRFINRCNRRFGRGIGNRIGRIGRCQDCGKLAGITFCERDLFIGERNVCGRNFHIFFTIQINRVVICRINIKSDIAVEVAECAVGCVIPPRTGSEDQAACGVLQPVQRLRVIGKCSCKCSRRKC